MKPILHQIVTFPMLLFTFTAIAQRPSITSVSPQSGAAGASVVITGSGFNATAASNTVRFGAVKAAVTSASIGSLTVTVPAGANYETITVRNNTSKLSGYSPLPFTTTFSSCSPFGSGSLSAKTDFAAGTTTRSIVFADLDADGKADMIATNTGTYNMSVFRNTTSSGTVSFAGKVDFITGVAGSAASGIAAGDIDGDGKLDIVVSSYNSAIISVFINTTTGSTISFATKVDFATTTNPLGVVIQDIDGDGKSDIAVANFLAATASISLFRNTSTTSTPAFASQTLTTGVTAPRELAFGDIDGDGKPDMVVSDEGGSKILAYRNTSSSGTISFAAPVSATTGTGPRGVSLGDLDGDGKLDVAVVNTDLGNTNPGSVSVFRNTSVSGTISLSAKTDFTCGVSPREIALADLDGDGKPEMAASNNLASGSTVSVFRNTSVSGTISFAGKTDFATGNNALGVAFNDVNNDGRLDLAVTSSSGGNVGVFANITSVSSLVSLVSANGATGSVCDNSTWKTLYDAGTNGVFASVKDNGNNLGTLNASVYVDASPGGTSRRYLARHYKITPSSQPSAPVQVRLYFTNAELLALKAVDPSVQSAGDLSVTKYSGPNEDGVYNTTGGTTVLIPSTSITTGTAFGASYLEFTISGFSEFWIHSGLTVLPSSLGSFTADKKAGQVLLKWSTTSEENSDRFVVERSADGRIFTAIGTVAASGIAAGYSYADAHPLSGSSYYRLQLVDRDGRKTVSKTLIIDQSAGAGMAVSIAYRSPRQVQASINSRADNGTFSIYDGNGRRIRSYIVQGQRLDLDLSRYGAGIYFYQLTSGNGNASGKIILQ